MIEITREENTLRQYVCRVWINENISGAAAGNLQSSITIKARGKGSFFIHKIAAEYDGGAHRHCSYYGFLGFEYLPDDGNLLTVTVNYIGNNQPKKNVCGGYRPSTVYEGIEEHYALPILREAEKQLSLKNTVPAGTILFNIGKTDDVGTSEKRFCFMVKLLFDLFYLNNPKIENDAVISLIEQANEYIKM